MKKMLVSLMFLFLALAFGAMTGYGPLCGAAQASTMPDSGDPDPDGGGGGSGGGPDDTDDGGGGGGGGSDPDGSGGGADF